MPILTIYQLAELEVLTSCETAARAVDHELSACAARHAHMQLTVVTTEQNSACMEYLVGGTWAGMSGCVDVCCRIEALHVATLQVATKACGPVANMNH